MCAISQVAAVAEFVLRRTAVFQLGCVHRRSFRLRDVHLPILPVLVRERGLVSIQKILVLLLTALLALLGKAEEVGVRRLPVLCRVHRPVGILGEILVDGRIRATNVLAINHQVRVVDWVGPVRHRKALPAGVAMQASPPLAMRSVHPRARQSVRAASHSLIGMRASRRILRRHFLRVVADTQKLPDQFVPEHSRVLDDFLSRLLGHRLDVLEYRQEGALSLYRVQLTILEIEPEGPDSSLFETIVAKDLYDLRHDHDPTVHTFLRAQPQA